jgi:small subunit ribosomal protein S17
MATEKKTKTAKPKKAAGATGAATARAVKETRPRREVVGVVVSDKMQKTIVVQIDRQVRHPLYKKYVTRSRNFKAHDEKNDAKIGDVVELVETRPLSRDKRWALRKVLRRAAQTVDANV